MRLNKIKLAGFKSFVDPTSIHLPGNLVSILGPNGCGKSNTIDAVRWVMGESSAKNLRGELMTDVIFNGSSSRKPVGQALVELIFDNSDGKLAGEFAKFNEVSVKRTINRDSQSFYYLNNSRCRRKDITDLFLGTGLGPKSYSIIEQGTISKLIESKPEELRVFIEEAAGISKYKERRRETQNRIRHTRENLERLEDIRNELEKQLARLQRQARTAKKYKQLKSDQRQIKAQLDALQWRDMDNQSLQQQLLITNIETKFEKTSAELRQIELTIEQSRESHQISNESFNQIQAEFYRIGSEVARLEQSIEHARERKKQHSADYIEANSAYEQAQQHLSVDKQKINEIKIEINKLEPFLKQAQEQSELSHQSLSECEQQMQDWQVHSDDHHRIAQKPGQIAQVERSKITQLEQQSRQLQQKTIKLEQELAENSSRQLVKDLDQLIIEKQAVQYLLITIEEQLQLQKQQSQDYNKQLKQYHCQINESKNQLSQLNGKKSSLEALQTAALGKDNTKAKHWLEQHSLSTAENLAQTIQVESGWENIIEYLLDDFLEAICVNDKQYPGLLDHLKQSQQPDFALTLIDLDFGFGFGFGFDKQQQTLLDNQNSHNNLVLASSLIKSNLSKSNLIQSNTAIKQLLNSIIAVNTLTEALSLLKTLDKHFSIVTKDGYYLAHHWIKVIYQADENSGVLLRKKVLDELNVEIKQLNVKIDEKEHLLENLQKQQEHSEVKKDQLQTQLNHQHKLSADVSNRINSKQVRIEHIDNRQKQLKKEIADNQQQISQSDKQITLSTQALHQALEDIETHVQQKQQLQTQREELQNKLKEFKVQYHQDKEQTHRLEIQVNGYNSELKATQQALSRVEQQINGLHNRCKQLQDVLNTETDPIHTLEEQLEENLSQKVIINEQLSQARNTLDDLNQKVRQFESKRLNLEQKIEIVRNELEAARIHWQELKVKRQTQQAMLDQSGFSISELLLQIPENADEKQWQRELSQLSQKISSLGAINLAAIDECQELQQRKEYLDSQNADLMQALSTLDGAIAKIDKETRTRFKTTFEHINTELKLLFPRLFGGGHAYLELTGEDMLDTGVTIMARPPGKRNSTIHLLSGGEKAMTAVALVFAIFSLNPSPFCMLDEVDAPLDEANVGRFCKMVKEMSEQIQFIYITHNKTTMEMSDFLCGVTMKEAGVSRIVDVDIQEAVEMVES